MSKLIRQLRDNRRWGGRASRLRPAIHMPRWASRLTLIVTATKVERLQEISFEDACAEGMPDFVTFLAAVGETVEARERENAADCARRLQWPQRWFADVWRDLHGAGSWDSNPEVVALTFTVHKRNIDALASAVA